MTKIIDAQGNASQLNSSPNGAPPVVAKTQEVVTAAEPLGEGAAERLARLREERARVSLSVPRQKMKVPEIPGKHLHWVNDHQGRVQVALRAGYAFVSDDEVQQADFSFAGDSTKTANSDMGSRVSMVVGADETGAPIRAYLMALPQELWEIDQALLQEQNDRIAMALKRGRIGTADVSKEDLAQTYVKSVEVSRRDVVIRPANPADVSKTI